jgi:class 3 adenylate cyclase
VLKTPPPASAAPLITTEYAIGLMVALLALNSILAALGSVLFAHFPFWPAFMGSALVASLRPWWGFALFLLSPIVSNLLGIGGSPSLAYLPVDALQATLVVVALRFLRPDPGLPTWADAGRYLLFVAVLPSTAGGIAGWLITQRVNPGGAGLPLGNYVLWWTLENSLPVLFPGIWLHRTIRQIGGGAPSLRNFQPQPWQQTVLWSIAPWLISLVLGGAVVVELLAREVANGGRAGSAALWTRVYDIAKESLGFRLSILLLSVAILMSIGSAVRFARRLWTMEEEISRRLPYRITDAPRDGRHHATVMFTDIRNFTSNSRRFPATDLVAWLNRYFDAMCDIAVRNNGMIDKFIGDGLMLVFGVTKGHSGSADAIACAIEMIRALEPLNRELEADGFPPISIGVGIHTGFLVAGEIGARLRLQYTVIGSTANMAARLESATKQCPADAWPIILSDDTAVDAGLLLTDVGDAIGAIELGNLKGLDTVSAWYVRDADAVLGRVARHRSGLAPRAD